MSNYYFKKEYQARGAPHYHVLLWIEGAPVIGIDPPEDVLSFIQNIITCNIQDKETDPELHHLVTTFQMHKCSGYCLRSRRVKCGEGGNTFVKMCKFNFPRTQSNVAELNPVDPSLKTRQRIYILPRSAAEVRINDYNPLILYLWKANVDIQYVAESSLALAGYVTAYVTKAEKRNLQDVWSKIASSGTIYSQLWSFGTRALKSREVGLYEASDLLLSNRIAEKSVTVQFVNARLPSKRSRMLKKMSDLRKLNEIDPDSEDVFVPTLIEDHYPARPDSLNDMCLYDFVKHIDWNHINHKNEKTFRRLQIPRVPNHPLFDPERPDQTDDYYYSLVLLFIPFRDEGELLLLDETPEQRHKNEGLLSHHDKLKKMLEATSKKKKIDEARKELEDGSKNDDEDDDGGGLQIKGDLKSDYEHILQLDPYPDPIDFEARVSMLNADQRRVYDKITSHLLHLQKHEKQECACTELKALNMFVSGVGGTGKSFLIQAIRAFVRATWPDTDNTTARGAPTGLAACNVNGMTTY